MSQFDVAIVGAGPAGSSTAITLAQRGYQVALLDRAVFPREKLCGDFLNPINWPVLEDLNVGSELLCLPHTKVDHFRISAADGAEAISALSAQGDRPFGLGLRRFHLDHALVARAIRAGVAVDQGVRLQAIERERRGWRLDMDHRGDQVSVRAKLLVGADGRNSWVARRLGVDSAPRKHSAAAGFEVQLRDVTGVRGGVEIHQFAGGYAGLVRVDESTVNLAFSVCRSRLGKAVSFESLRANCLSHNPALGELLRNSEPIGNLRSTWPVYFPARRCYGDGFVLVGDAARVTEPVTGEGIFLALRSGRLAGVTIAEALAEGRLDSHRLAAYGRACRAEFAARIRLNSVIRSLMYRPRLLSFALRLVGRRQRLLDSLVNTVCRPRSVVAG